MTTFVLFSRHDDPEMKALTRNSAIFLKSLDPGAPLSLFQHNSVAFSRLCTYLGVDNAIGATRVLNRSIQDQVLGVQ